MEAPGFRDILFTARVGWIGCEGVPPDGCARRALEPEGKKKKAKNQVSYTGVQVSRRQYACGFLRTADAEDQMWIFEARQSGV